MIKWLIICILILIDQITKLIPSNITKNYGLAFGLFPGYNLIYIILTLVIISILFYYLFKSKSKIKYGLSFLIAGSIGNLIDRILFGYVRDFISISIWPSFNIADIFNIVGVIIILRHLK